MKLVIRVQVYGSDGVVDEYTSNEFKGKEAEVMQGVVNGVDDLKLFSFPTGEWEVFFNRPMLDRSVVSCRVLEDETD